MLIFLGALVFTASNLYNPKVVNADEIPTLKLQVTTVEVSLDEQVIIVTCDPGGNGCLPSGG